MYVYQHAVELLQLIIHRTYRSGIWSGYVIILEITPSIQCCPILSADIVYWHPGGTYNLPYNYFQIAEGDDNEHWDIFTRLHQTNHTVFILVTISSSVITICIHSASIGQ